MSFSLVPSFLQVAFSSDKKFFVQIKELTGVAPRNLLLYKNSLRHSSASNDEKQSNERLEFLGDAILSSVVAEYLFSKFPFKDEGYLTELRSKMVSRSQLNSIAIKMGIDQLLDYNMNDVYLSKNSMSGNALEAIIGAVYVDRGFDKAQNFILHKIIKPYLDIAEVEISEFNYKSKLLEWGQKNGKTIVFSILSETRVKRNSLFKIGAIINGEEMGNGEDFNKKNAEKKAAKEAFLKLGLLQ